MKVCADLICSDFICINPQMITSEWHRELTKPCLLATIINEPQLRPH